MVKTIDMPAGLVNGDTSYDTSTASSKSHSTLYASRSSDLQRGISSEPPTPTTDALPGAWPQTPLGFTGGGAYGGKDGGVLNVPNGGVNGHERALSARSSVLSTRTGRSSGFENEKKSGEVVKEAVPRPGAAEEGYFTASPTGAVNVAPRSPLVMATTMTNGEGLPSQPSRSSTIPTSLPALEETATPKLTQPNNLNGALLPPPSIPHHHRASSPPIFSPNALPNTSSIAPVEAQPRPDRLAHRHTLGIPQVNTRVSADGRELVNVPSEGNTSASTERFSPDTPVRRRGGSLQLARRVTRSLHAHSDMQLDQVPQDEDASRWADHYKAKRASRRNRVDTDDDRVVVGTKVDEHHVNYIRAYNMLTGIRFSVSRCMAKMPRPITDADFTTRNKFSFDMFGNELTPSAKYDFKFKDYAPWVFREIRNAFKLDPAEYLVSLTSKYILSELGSPGKSGSFFYFSRDYKYIIKTIHHGEHKFLRKILRDYYDHIVANPNTLLSQFYGLHRVKLPYGKKVHFVVMNNLFPPHRDIHRTFDLKGSTIGRDFREEDLEKNPRATLKDLNWLRRNLHLEFGPTKKEVFVAQMQRDVQLLQRLKIMDYSLLVGIHDLERGNEENLRDKTLQVFQPRGEVRDQDPPMGGLVRTPSKMETAKRARDFRDTVKRQRPIPMAQAADKMPDEAHRTGKGFYFYADDGGFQATHEDDVPGEEIYYLGIIDCLTRYNMTKKAEHFWKGFGGHESQISPIPPDRYGDRFVKFISGVTMSRERAAERASHTQTLESEGLPIPAGIEGTVTDPRLGGSNLTRDKLNPIGTEKVMEKAEREAERSRRRGADEDKVPERLIIAARHDGHEATLPQVTSPTPSNLPVIGEAAESSSNASRTPSRITPVASHEDIGAGVPPPTPPKGSMLVLGNEKEAPRRESWGGGPPPTPPKDDVKVRYDKSLPLPPPAIDSFDIEEELAWARRRADGVA